MDELARFAVDVTTGYLAARALEPVLEPAWKVVRSVLFPRWGEAVHEARLRLDEHFAELRTRGAETIEALQHTLREGEADALAAALVRAAAQATTDERMRMLAAAAAGVFTPDLTSEMRSRVTRAIAEIEPSDVHFLRSLDGFGGAHGFDLHREYEGLLHAGCVAIRGLGGGLVRGGYVTSTGGAVLEALRRWTAVPPTPCR